MVVAVVLGALAVLWTTYRFRYPESPAPSEVFNRPLADKISDASGVIEALANRLNYWVAIILNRIFCGDVLVPGPIRPDRPLRG